MVYRRRCFALVLISITLTSSILQAQLKPKVNEEVRVYHGFNWRDGTVLKIRKNQFLVDLGFEGEEVFDRPDVRRLFEVDAIDYGRNWETANGKFKVVAALKSIDGDELTLIKSDLREIKVPLEKFCDRDKAYIKKFKKARQRAVVQGEMPDIIPELPEIEIFDYSFGFVSTFFRGTEVEAKPVGGIPKYLKQFKTAGVGFNRFRFRQQPVAAIPVGGPDQLVLFSAREDNWINDNFFQSQLYWLSLAKKKVIGFVSITPEDYAIDYDPKTKLLLTFNRSESQRRRTDEPDNYTIWKLQPGGDKAVPLQRWQAKGMGWAEHLFGKIINERIVLAKTDRQTYEAWDLVEKKSLYVIKQESFFDAPVKLTLDRKYLIVPEDGQLGVIDAATGKAHFYASIDSRHISGANVDSSGQRLVAVDDDNIYLWNLNSDDSEPEIYPAPLVGSPFTSHVYWVDDDHVIVASNRGYTLYRLSLKLPVWSYEMDVRETFLNDDPLLSQVVDGMFFYSAEPGIGFDGTMAVGVVELPGPAVNEITSNIDRTSLMILKAGVPVSIELNNCSPEDDIEEWLKQKVRDNGWIYNPDAEIKLIAEMGIGEKQSVTYEEIGGSGKTKTIKFKPHYSNLTIKRGDLLVWRGGTRTGAPSIVSGANWNRQVQRMQKPRPEFFKNVKIDSEMIDPKYARGFGVSKFGLRGIEVVSTSPPGRDANPYAAAKQAQVERLKELEKNREMSGSNNSGGGSDNKNGGSNSKGSGF